MGLPQKENGAKPRTNLATVNLNSTNPTCSEKAVQALAPRSLPGVAAALQDKGVVEASVKTKFLSKIWQETRPRL